MNRAEHMQWCKDRSLAYLPHNPHEAMISMLSDLGKHSETQRAVELGFMLMMATDKKDLEAVRRFIEGFN